MAYLKVEEIKRPLIKGELFWVPCIVQVIQNIPLEMEKICITPIINHAHNDIENGQKEIHYHADFRFIKHKSGRIINRDSRYVFGHEIRPELGVHGNMEYILLPVINEQFYGITPSEMIKNSKLRHKCIHNGKCPHRGYDLSQVQPIDGKIICPLHGLAFDENTGNLL